jgi:putative radical SAM enzyme (TIGR03279 family)
MSVSERAEVSSSKPSNPKPSNPNPGAPGSSRPVVVSIVEGSPAARAGVLPGDEIALMNGEVVRDVIQYRLLADDADPELVILRGGLELEIVVEKDAGQTIGIEVQSALFDQLRTCDNHCSFCFIYQLPPGMRESLYLKDDDYRLSFLYGNFTTLTRFTEADLERVVTEGLSPLNVSIHATDPEVRSQLLRNRRGAMSLRWLRALLDNGIEVHGQLVVCPGINDGAVLEDTLAGVLDRFPDLASIHAVPLGISKYNKEPGLRLHTREEAVAVIETVERWQNVFLEALGHRLVFAADEYYLMAGRSFPPNDAYEDFCQHENGIGMFRTFERELLGEVDTPTAVASGFFAWVEGAPAEGYRAPRAAAVDASANGDAVDAVGAPGAVGALGTSISLRPRKSAPVGVLTGEYGASVLGALLPPVLTELGRSDVRIIAVANEFFGGNTAVAGLMVGADLARVLAAEPEGHRYLLPDVCLSKGMFLDGTRPEDLPRPVEIVETNGLALREALSAR